MDGGQARGRSELFLNFTYREDTRILTARFHAKKNVMKGHEEKGIHRKNELHGISRPEILYFA